MSYLVMVMPDRHCHRPTRRQHKSVSSYKNYHHSPQHHRRRTHRTAIPHIICRTSSIIMLNSNSSRHVIYQPCWMRIIRCAVTWSLWLSKTTGIRAETGATVADSSPPHTLHGRKPIVVLGKNCSLGLAIPLVLVISRNMEHCVKQHAVMSCYTCSDSRIPKLYICICNSIRP